MARTRLQRARLQGVDFVRDEFQNSHTGGFNFTLGDLSATYVQQYVLGCLLFKLGRCDTNFWCQRGYSLRNNRGSNFENSSDKELNLGPYFVDIVCDLLERDFCEQYFYLWSVKPKNFGTQ